MELEREVSGDLAARRGRKAVPGPPTKVNDRQPLGRLGDGRRGRRIYAWRLG